MQLAPRACYQFQFKGSGFDSWWAHHHHFFLFHGSLCYAVEAATCNMSFCGCTYVVPSFLVGMPALCTHSTSLPTLLRAMQWLHSYSHTLPRAAQQSFSMIKPPWGQKRTASTMVIVANLWSFWPQRKENSFQVFWCRMLSPAHRVNSLAWNNQSSLSLHCCLLELKGCILGRVFGTDVLFGIFVVMLPS